jgi:polysaccharide biosynthesis protein PslH
MQILLLTPQLPYPLDQGTAIRNFAILQHLAASHAVDLVTFAPSPHDPAMEGPLSSLCRTIRTTPQPNRTLSQRLRNTVASPLPDMALRLEAPAMHYLINSLLANNQYDLVQIEGIEMAQYGLKALKIPAQPKIIFDDHNCEFLLQKRNALNDFNYPSRWVAALYSVVQWRKLWYYERSICQCVHATVAVSEPDRQALHQLAPAQKITVVPNGIELAPFPTCPPSGVNPSKLLFTGKMDYRPNVDAVLWFAEEVLPRIRQHRPDVTFQIVGKNPHPRLQPLQQNPAIEITGAVPSIIPYLLAAGIYVIPMRVGGGTRFKALEAMAAFKPIVSTPLGVEGIPIHNEHNLLLAATPETFANSVLRLLQDYAAGGQLAAKLGSNARKLVSETYTWPAILPKLDTLYERLLLSH